MKGYPQSSEGSTYTCAAGLFGSAETLDDCRSSRGGAVQTEEDGTDTSQYCVERSGHGEVAGDDFDVRWQRRRRLGAMREGADRHARVY